MGTVRLRVVIYATGDKQETCIAVVIPRQSGVKFTEEITQSLSSLSPVINCYHLCLQTALSFLLKRRL